MARGKRVGSAQKFTGALTVIKGEKSAVEAARDLGCHPSMIAAWKAEIEERGAALFERASESDDKNKKIAKLDRLIGALTLENGFLDNSRAAKKEAGIRVYLGKRLRHVEIVTLCSHLPHHCHHPAEDVRLVDLGDSVLAASSPSSKCHGNDLGLRG